MTIGQALATFALVFAGVGLMVVLLTEAGKQHSTEVKAANDRLCATKGLVATVTSHDFFGGPRFACADADGHLSMLPSAPQNR